jgi:hypothetical protein
MCFRIRTPDRAYCIEQPIESSTRVAASSGLPRARLFAAQLLSRLY